MNYRVGLCGVLAVGPEWRSVIVVMDRFGAAPDTRCVEGPEISQEARAMADFDLPKQALQLIEEVKALEARAEAARKMITDDLEELRHIGASRRDEIGSREVALRKDREDLQRAKEELEAEREKTRLWKQGVEEEVRRDQATAASLVADHLVGFTIV